MVRPVRLERLSFTGRAPWLGAPERTHPEPHSLAVEQFLVVVRFEQRSKLAELPSELVRGRDVFV